MDLSRHNYQAWLIDEKSFPAKGSLQDQIRFLIGYGILAPSTHNTQPWAFEIDDSDLKIKPDWHYQLPAADSTGRNLFISLGACAFNVVVAAAHFGLATVIRYEGTSPGNGQIVISFALKKKTDGQLAELFPQITRRHSEKRFLKGQKLGAADMKKLRALSDQDAEILLNDSQADIQVLARLCYQASASYASHPTFSRELSRWMRANGTTKQDGMPGFTNGLKGFQVFLGKVAMNATPKSLKVLAKKYLKLLQLSSEVGVVTTRSDAWQDWAKAGVAYERLSLVASALGISLCPMAALIETAEREQLQNFFATGSRKPQIFFRLLKSSGEIVHTPRRTISRKSAEASIVERLKQEGLDIVLDSRRVGRYRINYVTAGAGHGRPLVLIHGANIGWGQWMPNLSQLSKHFKVIAVDLPGCGGSTPVEFRKMKFDVDFVTTMADFIKQLKLPDLAITGHSFGGAIAIRLAQHEDLDVKKLVLVSPMGFTRKVPGRQKLITLDAFAKLLSRTALKSSRPNMAKFLAEPLASADMVTPELVDYYWTATSENHRNHPLLFMNALTKPLVLKQELLLVKDLKQVSQPVLTVIGDKDPLTPVKAVKSAIMSMPNARLEIFTNTGHVPSLEESDRFNKTVLDFLV